MPALDVVVGVFMSKSAYHTNYSKVFAAVPKYPGMEKWLENADDAPADDEVWGEHRPSFENLKMIVLGPKQKKSSKGKKRQVDSSSPVKAVKKGKGKKVESSSDSEVKKRKSKKAGNSGKKTAGSSKDRY
jgi:predicted RNA-binding protein